MINTHLLAKMFSAPNCFELFEGCCLSNDFKGHPNLIQMCKYLKQEPLAITEKSKQFIGYALKNGLLADFVVDLSKNDDAVCELFDKTAFLRTPSLISTFIQTLISLEKLDFSLTISSQGYVIEEDNIDLQSSKQNQLEKDKQSVLSGSQYTESDVTSRIKSPPSIKKKRKVKNRIVELD